MTCGNYTNRNRNGFNGDILVLDSFIRAAPGAEPGIVSGASATAWSSTAWAKPWVNQSCCTAAYSNALQGGLTNLYANWSYDYCGTISDRCRAFLYWEEAAFQCDPFLAQYSDPTSLYGSLVGVPLCASYCDDWWDACRYDSTCATNWATNFPTDANYNYGCAAGDTYPADGSGPPVCSTFASRFPGRGRDLCTNMWGSTFTYSTNASSCLSMYFYTAANPNAAAMGYGATNTPTPPAAPAAAPAALTQGQALGIGLGVGLGVPAALLIAAAIAYACGHAAGLNAAAAAAGASVDLPQRNPAPPAAAAAAAAEWSGKA